LVNEDDDVEINEDDNDSINYASDDTNRKNSSLCQGRHFFFRLTFLIIFNLKNFIKSIKS
jgi:hypothetical protein